MKTYRNERLGFEIEIPEAWSFEPGHQIIGVPGKERSLIFDCRSCEAFNLQIKSLTVPPDLERTEDQISFYAHERGYTSLSFGRLSVAEKEHLWARYYTGYGNWSKKYVLVLNQEEYTFTAACLDQKLFLEMERTWDDVVRSFRLLMPAEKTTQLESESIQQSSTVTNQKESENGKVAPQPSTRHAPAGMKTYHNEKHGFEIDMPETWVPAPELPGLEEALAGPIPPGKDCFQYGCFNEAINFEIGRLYPEPLLDDTVIEFKVYAQVQGFRDLHFGRIYVAGKEHVCAHYFINDNMGPRWNKKYMLVFGGIEYALTLTCNDPIWFANREKDWDAIIQSFRVLSPIDDAVNTTPKADRDRQIRREVVQERIEMLRDPAKILAKSYQAIALGQYVDARALLEEFLRSQPDHIDAHRQLAALLQKMGDRTGAVQHLKEVERLDPADSANRSKLVKLVADSSGKAMPVTNIDRSRPRPESSLRSSNNVQDVKDKTKRDYTLSFSIYSYLAIVFFGYFYIHSKGLVLRTLLSLSSATHEPLSASEFNILWWFTFLGIGALICLLFLLGVSVYGERQNNTSTMFGLLARTMRTYQKEQKTLGDILFSDYNKKPQGMLDALRLQVMNFIRALFKIVMIFLSVGLLHPVMALVIAILVFGPGLVWHRPQSILWQAGTAILWFYSCYRAMLFRLARLQGIEKETGATNIHSAITVPSLNSSIQSAMTKGVTPDFIARILEEESVIHAIKSDLRKTDQIGYKETWRLGLITPDQDMYDLRLDGLSRQERLKQISTNSGVGFNFRNQIPLKRTAVIHSSSYFNFQANNILITDGKIKQLWPRWSNYRLRTILNQGESICLRNIQIDTNRPYAENRSQSLTQFLREDGFPLKESYQEGDPLSTERGGIILIDKGKILITYPKYFVQRRLIDDEGNLVDLGIDENFRIGGIVELKIQPAVLNSLIRYTASHGYIPVLRYHSCPGGSEYMLPILDTPVSANGWADLFINTRGQAKLFIAKENTQAEWVEMMNKLKQLFYKQLADKHYHLLEFTKDKEVLSYYLFKKQRILEDYYIIQNWSLR